MCLSEKNILQSKLCAETARLELLVRQLLEDRTVAEVDDRIVQRLFVAVVKLYVTKLEAEANFPPFTGDELNATDVVMTVTEMLKAQNLELFELGMWQAWNSTISTKGME